MSALGKTSVCPDLDGEMIGRGACLVEHPDRVTADDRGRTVADMSFTGAPNGMFSSLSKVFLRIVGLPEAANAFNDVVGDREVSLSELVRRAERALDARDQSEFRDIAEADRGAAKAIVIRAYERIVDNPSKEVIVESVVGTQAIERLVDEAMPDHDRLELARESDGFRAFVAAFREAIAAEIAKMFETVPAANQVAMTRAAGEQLQLARETQGIAREAREVQVVMATKIDDILDRISTPAVPDQGEVGDVPKRIEFKIGLTERWYDLCDDEADFLAKVEDAVTAVVDGKAVDVVVSAPEWMTGIRDVDDALHRSRALRQVESICARIAFALNLLFSPAVETHWGRYLTTLDAWADLAASCFRQSRSSGNPLKIWRTEAPEILATALLSRDETAELLAHLGFDDPAQLSVGAFWRAADEIPDRLIMTRVLPALLKAMSAQREMLPAAFPDGALSLPSWHIGLD